jgi:hypothetical protein
MIHLALWIASALFLIWFACLVIPLLLVILWKCRWVIGGGLLIFIAYASQAGWFPQTTSPSVSPAQPQNPGDAVASVVIAVVILVALLVGLKLGSKTTRLHYRWTPSQRANRKASPVTRLTFLLSGWFARNYSTATVPAVTAAASAS